MNNTRRITLLLLINFALIYPNDQHIVPSQIDSVIAEMNSTPFEIQCAYNNALHRFRNEHQIMPLLTDVYNDRVYSSQEVAEMRKSGITTSAILTVDADGIPYIDGDFVFEVVYANGKIIKSTIQSKGQTEPAESSPLQNKAIENYNSSPQNIQYAYQMAVQKFQTECGITHTIAIPQCLKNKIYSPQEIVELRNKGTKSPILTVDTKGCPYLHFNQDITQPKQKPLPQNQKGNKKNVSAPMLQEIHSHK